MTGSFGSILVGIDFSPSAELALGYAVRLAEAVGARLDLVHIHHTPIITTPEVMLDPPDEVAAVTWAQKELREMAARTVGERAPVRLHVRTDSTVSGLLQIVHELGPDLVVVGSHGRGAVMRALLGSVAEHLCRRSPVPVVVVPAPGRADRHDDPGRRLGGTHSDARSAGGG